MRGIRGSLWSNIRHRHFTPAVIRQLVKYGVTGASAVLTDYGTFALLFGLLKTPLFVATTCSLLAGFVVSFLLNRIWVFEAHKDTAHKSARMQVVLYVLLLSFNTGFTYIFVKGLTEVGLNAYLGKLASIGVIMVWNYIIYKKIIFRLA